MDIIIAPIVTEKSMNDAAKGKFTFKVHKQAEKQQIKKIIESKFKVDVIRVATITVKGKMKKTGKKRMDEQTQGYKKAIVSLKQGQKIDLFEVGGKEK